MHGVETFGRRRIDLRIARDETGGLGRGLGCYVAELTRLPVHALDQAIERRLDGADPGKLALGMIELVANIGDLPLYRR